MALTDSMFLFEIIVEELTSFISCREFCIKSQFADIFNIHLKDPNEQSTFLLKRSGKQKIKRKTKIRNAKGSDKSSTAAKVQMGQSILFENNVDTLISNMKQYPMELSLWSKVVPDYKIGSTHIPWSAPYYEYLNKLHRRQGSQPVCVRGDYNVFDEFTSKRMAVIKLHVKLSYLKDKTTSQFRPISQENQQNSIYMELNPKPKSAIKDKPIYLTEETGIIKTFYSGEKRKDRRFIRSKNRNIKKEKFKDTKDPSSKDHVSEFKRAEVDNKIYNRKINSGIVTLVRSDINLDKKKHLDIKSQSCSKIDQGNFNMLNYIFGGKPAGPFGNQVYCVGYFTVQNDFADSPKSVESVKAASEESKSSKSSKSPKSSKSDEVQAKERYKFRICESECPIKKTDIVSCTQSVCSLDLPPAASHLVTVKKCDHVDCNFRKMRVLPTPPDDRILLDLSSGKKDCCDISEKVEEVVGGIKAKMKFGNEPCYCECECKFGFMKKTTFCGICGGYENFGDEYAKQPGYELPFPCPIFHKLVDKNKMKISTSGSDTKRDKKELSEPKKEKKELIEPKKDKKEVSEPKREKKEISEPRREKKEAGESKKEKKEVPKQKPVVVEKSSESEKETTKKGKKKRKDDRFKFNYGYTAPRIGHSRCLIPCGGGYIGGAHGTHGTHSTHGIHAKFGYHTLGTVPKRMGWLWTAENVPGLKFRPLWKPGATNKHVVRLLKIAKNPGEIMAKKRKKDTGKVKRPLKRPLLTVLKKDGEYTVTMETMKNYTKPRTFNQYPYEDKPLVTYTIGRTAEENLQRKIKKERAQRRLERLQRDFVQSAFRDMCQEICHKTYQQALGILPDAEHPDCSCFPAEPGPGDVDLDHSCSCSEDKELSESDTDSDEWIVEFTPPNATFDPTFKSKKVATVDNSTQYSFMDFRVKLVDRYGNPVPRYFKGPDGKQLCSDLGGFWGPNNKWLEINTDGFIGPDERWAPHNFIGPNGELVDAETGKFQAMDGNWLVVGVDGYVDQGKWKFYPKPKGPEPKKKLATGKKMVGVKTEGKQALKTNEATWSCFGSVSPKQLSKMGIVGHGHDKKLLLSTLRDMLAHGEDVKIPEPTIVPRSNKRKGGKHGNSKIRSFIERRKCKHATPSDKGIVAVDGYGNKIYFKLKDFANRRPKDRMTMLTDQGISLSSFHVPCFHSFISCEMMKKQQYERLVALAKRAGGGATGGRGGGQGGNTPNERTTASTQADYVYVV